MYNIVLSVATDLLAGISEFVSGIADMILDLLQSLVGLFYGGTPTPTLTVFGWLGLFGIAYALVVKVGIPFVRKFFVK